MTASVLALAAPASLTPLSHLVQKADVVVIAKVQSGTVIDGSCSLVVEVERTIKGKLARSLVITVAAQFRGEPHTADMRINLDRGLFFLEQSANGSWTVLPLVSGSLHSPRSLYFALGRSSKPKSVVAPLTTYSEQVLAEVIGSMDDAGGQSKDSPVSLEMEYRLLKNPSVAIKQLYAAAEKSANPRLKRAGLAARMTDEDSAAR